MSGFLSFFRSKHFFIHTALILLVIGVLVYATLHWLGAYTGHGKYVMVPDFRGKRIVELEDYIKDKQVEFQIIDSIYDPSEKPGMVLRQDPEMNTRVKHNRTVYLYVTGMVPPQVKMPTLVDRSERQARLIVRSYGLKMRNVEYKEADCEGCVLEQKVNGRTVEAGTPVAKGSAVDLVVGAKEGYNLPADTTAMEEDEPDFE